MDLLILLLLFSPAVLAQRNQKPPKDPNDEPFLPIFPTYPYNPKLLKRGLDQQQQQQHSPGQHPPGQQFRSLPQPASELYAPRLDARDSYSLAGGAPSSGPQEPFRPIQGPGGPQDPQKPLGSAQPQQQQQQQQQRAPAPPGLFYPSGELASSPYAALSQLFGPFGFGLAPLLPPSPYYHPGFFNYPYHPRAGYHRPPPGTKHPHFRPEDDEESYRPAKKNRLRDISADGGYYVDGGNYIVASGRDLDSDSSTHRLPSAYNQIEDSSSSSSTPLELDPRLTKIRIFAVKGKEAHTDPDYPEGYVKLHQIEQLMRQALQRLLAQSGLELAREQPQQQQQQQQLSQPAAAAIGKTGLTYVVSPAIFSRLLQGKPAPVGRKPATPSAVIVQQAQEYVDYDAPQETATLRNAPGGYQTQSSVTAQPQPTRAYVFSTYRPQTQTQRGEQTSLEDVDFSGKPAKPGS